MNTKLCFHLNKTYYNRHQGQWVCLRCAQNANNQEFKRTIFLKNYVRPCISKKEYVWKTLQGNVDGT